jgi:hypothetical protein
MLQKMLTIYNDNALQRLVEMEMNFRKDYEAIKIENK